MGFDPELEEILKSIKNKDATVESKTTPIDLPPPKKQGDLTLEEIPSKKAEPKKEELPAEKKQKKPTKKEEPPVEKPEKENKPVKEKPEKKQKPVKEKPEKKERAPKPKKEKKAKAEAKSPVKSLCFKIGCAAALVAIICAAVFFVNKSMYLKKYEEKYAISFPKGIPEELCDYYGKNQTLAGSIIINDNESEIPVFSSPADGEALFEKGSTVEKDQHYRAAAISARDADLEALYKTPEAYTASTQSFTFKTIYGEKEKYHVIAAYIINTRPEDDNGYAFPYNAYGNFTKESYRHYQDTITRRSLYDTGYKIKETDYCMTLSVPSDVMPFFRFVIVGVKVDKVEKIAETKENKMIRYPQAYCEKLGIHNVFNFAYKWYPEIIINPDTGDTKQLTAEDFGTKE